jgi:quercetin dioxygenase-like cupin family protein
VAVASLGGDARPAPAPAGVHITPLSKGTIGSSVHAKNAGIEITTKGRKDLLITSITVDPGGSFGWHSHPGPVLVAVSKGTLAMYEAHGHGCPRSTVTAGQAFIEDGGHVHLARNEGSGPVELNAAFLAHTGTTEFLTPEREPRGCDV